MEISLNKFTHCKLQRRQTLRSDTQIAAKTVRLSNRWPLKKIAKLFPKSIHGPDRSLLHSERLSKFWLLEITRVYQARHVKCHFVSDKQTRCWHELSKVTNQRVYQELVYRNEVFKTMLTGSHVVPSFSTRSRSSPARFFNRPHWQRAWNRLFQNRLEWQEILEMLWSVMRLISKPSSVTPRLFFTFLIKSYHFLPAFKVLKKSARGKFWVRTSLSST